MIARAFTNVYKYFSSSQHVKPAPALSGATAPPLSNFKRAAKRAAAANSEGAAKAALAPANFVGCQILKAAAILCAAAA